jgi:hypothetical protein
MVTITSKKINKQQHLANKMPKNPSLDQRIFWHTQHSKNCKCRKMPENLILLIKNQKK